ncbi:type 2 lanthipeptide synthetase LanM [Synechococcus sp. NOUM97013]|uniref:type 2 lanthipeptide synthetase LanM n=1 Tax=Synechococcus sp. NOUM97013 TaxID=1442555 RepID=UPI0016443EAC|nr:type 2 lanthipeptide synthetase LanM [Synechococcus sp. NOUM97013]QNI74798.1 type II lanthionine synthetase [Synechococcus sp. NOUM97013]
MIEEIVEIAQRASNIRERIAHYRSRKHCAYDPQGKYYSDEFIKNLTPETQNENLLRSRLQYLAIHKDELVEAFSCMPIYSSFTLPKWAQTLLEIMSTYELNECKPKEIRHQTEDGFLLFPKLLAPFTNHFDKNLEKLLAVYPSIFELQAILDLKTELLIELSEVTARVVSTELSMKKYFYEKNKPTREPKERYQDYMDQFVDNPQQHIRLFLRYPVLARLLCMICSQTLENLTTFAHRFESDRSEIAKYFKPEKTYEKPDLSIIRLSFTHSDPHNQGQKVWKVTTNHSFSLAYKPRSFDIDKAYADIIKWYNNGSQHQSLKTAPFISRKHYGWTLWIDTNRSVASRKEASDYFQRLGAHCAILFLLNATDFHEENFIIQQSDPIPVDLETIGSSCMSYYTPENTSDLPFYLESLSLSIQALGAYPRWLQNKSAGAPAIALGGSAGRQSIDNNTLVIRWNQVGTADLNYQYVEGPVGWISLSPQINGEEQKLVHYIEDYLAGFEDAYLHCLENRSFLLKSKESPFLAFDGLNTRVVLRNTQEYFDLLQPATSHDILTSGLAYCTFLEKICHRQLGNYAHNLYFTSESEANSLFSRDIPYFSGRIGRTTADGQTEKPYGSNDPKAFTYKLKIASQAKLEDYKQQIKSIFGSYQQSIEPPALSVKATQAPQTNKDILIKGVRNLTDLFLNSMVTIAGFNGWYSVYSYKQNPTISYRFPLPWTSAGTAGTSIFLNNAATMLKDSSLSTLAEKLSVNSLSELIKNFGLADQYSIALCKGLEGIASPIYACLCAHRLSQSERALEHAADFIETMGTNYKNIKLRDLSLISGASADLIVLSELYQRTQRPLLKEIINVLAMKLVMALESLNSFLNTNPQLQPIEPGVAHGIFGILLAIDRANDVEPKDIYRSVILHYGYKEMKRYLDQPNERDERFTGWCRGPAGEGLAILDNQLLLNSHLSMMTNDYIDTTIELTKRSLGQDFAHLCCGESGRLIFLATAGEQLNRPELSDLAVNQSVNLLRQYEDTGYLMMQSITSSCLVPGLLDGHAGIGLALLSVLHPKSTSNYLCLR